MRIILVSPYSSHLVGGIVNWTSHIVDFYQKHGDGIDLRLVYNRHPVGLYGKGNLFQRIKTGLSNYLPVCKEFQKLLKTERFDVAHVSSSAGYGLFRDLIISRCAKKHGVKICVHMHFGRIPQLLVSKGWEAIVFRFLIKRIDHAIVMDMASYKALQSYGFNNVSYLPNPLGERVQELIENCKDVERGPRKVLFAGHVTASKGVYELVKACRGIGDVKLDLYGKVLGEGTIRELYELDGDGNGNDKRLDIPGNKSMEEVIHAMKSCAVFALPSYSEGFPNVIIEAMACGCPIVATPVGAIPEMLNINGDSACGICVPVKNVEQLQHAIVELLDNPAKAKALGDNACKRVNAMYTMPKVWAQLVGIWKSLV